jgi:hypothetical protein
MRGARIASELTGGTFLRANGESVVMMSTVCGGGRQLARRRLGICRKLDRRGERGEESDRRPGGEETCASHGEISFQSKDLESNPQTVKRVWRRANGEGPTGDEPTRSGPSWPGASQRGATEKQPKSACAHVLCTSLT